MQFKISSTIKEICFGGITEKRTKNIEHMNEKGILRFLIDAHGLNIQGRGSSEFCQEIPYFGLCIYAFPKQFFMKSKD
jgi:hypothetical protein